MNKINIVGEVLTHVDQGDDVILLTTESGRQIQIYHDQDCCGSVMVESTDGAWHTLYGKVIEGFEVEEIKQGSPPPEYPDSWTRTNITFRCTDATVVSRWIGESNGYYSEQVDFKELV